MRHLAYWLALSVACAPGADHTDESERERRVESEPAAHSAAGQPPYLERYDFEAGGERYDLPGRLDEISGLATTADGRLFAHDDERARVYEIDPVSGEVGKSFDLGSGEILDDFEGMAIVDDRFFLVSSSGFLYEFGEGDDEENVGYRAADTGLGDGCEIEGLDHDPAADVLLFACKQTEADREFVVVRRMSLDAGAEVGTGVPEALSPVLVSRADLAVFGLDRDFQPSAVLATPAGTLLLTSAATEAIVEVDAGGRVLAGTALSPRRHPQPEGLALASDGSLLVADEENDDDARLTRYTPRGSGDR